MAVRAFQQHPTDSVAVLLQPVAAGDTVEVHSAHGGQTAPVVFAAADAVPAAHKIAITDIAAGSAVRKYGYEIGTATRPIRAGEHVHVHNIVSRTSQRVPTVEDPAGTVDTASTTGTGARSDTVLPRFDAEQLIAFAESIASQAGAHQEAAHDLATAMVDADLRGVHTHGIRRLAPYAQRIRAGSVDGDARPSAQTTDGSIRVNGHNGVGHHVARYACDRLIELSSHHGIAAAAVFNSNHFGSAGYYATYLAQHGMIGIVTSNGTPCVAPIGGVDAFFSNNPFAIAAPLGSGFVELDLALSSISRARVAQALEAGVSIPSDWAFGPDGRSTTDPATALAGTMQPFGGERGLALLFALELLSGVLSGAAVADEVAPKDKSDRPEGTGHFMIGIRIDRFGTHEWFEERLAGMVQRMKSARLVEGAEVPRFPGERRHALRAQRLSDGVPLTLPTVESLQKLAQSYGMTFPKQRGSK